jgi:ribosomal protection tetracycline resistance protein
MHRFQLGIPADLFGAVLPVLVRLGAAPRTQTTVPGGYLLAGDIPAARVHELQQSLPSLTRGEGALECAFDHYQGIRGAIPSRSRSDHNPLNRKEYLLHVMRRV